MLNLTGEVKYKRNMSRFPSRPKNYLIERIHHVLPLPVREYLLIHLSNRKHLPCSINVLLPITRGVVLCFDSVPLHRSAQFGCAKILRTPVMSYLSCIIVPVSGMLSTTILLKLSCMPCVPASGSG